jgi:hypothetical protein
MEELIQLVGSLLGLGGLLGVLVLFLLWWSTRRDREQLHRQLGVRERQVALPELVPGDASRQGEQQPEEEVPEYLPEDVSPPAQGEEEEREAFVPEVAQEDASRQSEQPPEAEGPESLPESASPQIEEPRDASHRELLQRVEEMKRRHGLDRRRGEDN